MSQETLDSKWEGKSIQELKGITADQLWPLFEDFCTIHRWIPDLDSEKCHQVEGEYGKPGLVRYCVFVEQTLPSSSLPIGTTVKLSPARWFNDKLLAMDPVQRTLSYEVTENNLGFKSYVGNVKVTDTDDGCKIEWSFVSDPVEGMTVEDLRGFLESNVKTVAGEMGSYCYRYCYLSSGKEKKDAKWEGKSSQELKGVSVEQLWPFFEDFCSIHKWVPALDSEKCHEVEGDYGKPGLVRYCAFVEQQSISSSSLSMDTTEKLPARWCNEKLLSMDMVGRTLSYEVTENNIGFGAYVANVRLVEIDGGCKIEWSFDSDPVEGMRVEDLRGFLESNLKSVAEGMKKELQEAAN